MADKPRLPLDDFRVSFRAWRETELAVKKLTTVVVGDRRIRFGGKRANQSVLLNALLLWFDEQPEDKRIAILARGMERVNKIVDAAEGGDPLPRVEIGDQEEPKGSSAKDAKGRPKRRA